MNDCENARQRPIWRGDWVRVSEEGLLFYRSDGSQMRISWERLDEARRDAIDEKPYKSDE